MAREGLADELPLAQVAKRWIVASDRGGAVAQTQPYVDAGMNHLVFHSRDAAGERFLQQMAEGITPKLRDLAGPTTI